MKILIRKMVSKLWFPVTLVVLWVIFFNVGENRLDPDFGWHYQMGNFITTHGGVPKTDPFSYTMASFHFVDHEWLTNVLLFCGYNVVGNMGLAAIYAILVVSAMLLATPSKLWKWAVPGMLLAATVLLPRGGVRPQVESWLFLAILYRWLAEKNMWRRTRWFVPIFFVLWANLHGGFALGLGILGLVIAVRSIEEKKISFKDLAVWILSGIGTLINPYGWRLWYEVWMQITDSNLRWAIAEWQPFFASVEFGLYALIVFLVGLGWKIQKGVELWKRVLVMGLFLAGLSSMRHSALFAVVAIPILAWVIKEFYTVMAINEEITHRVKVFLGILVGICIGIFVWNSGWTAWSVGQGWVNDKFYPRGGVEYLKSHTAGGNIFSEYGWGGYLIWKLPGKKVFIDGRMPSWRWGLWPVNEKAPKTESQWAFKDFTKIVEKADFEQLFAKYNVDTVLWPAEIKNPWVGKINNWLARFHIKIGTGEKDKKETFTEKLKRLGWKVVYSDATDVVYQKYDL